MPPTVMKRAWKEKQLAWDALFTGAVDEVLLFNRALSSAEVSAVAGKVVTTKTLGISGDAKKAKKKGKTVITVICGKSKKKVKVTVN